MLLDQEFPDATGKMKQFASWFTHQHSRAQGLRKAVEKFFSTRLTTTPAEIDQFATAFHCVILWTANPNRPLSWRLTSAIAKIKITSAVDSPQSRSKAMQNW